MIRKALFIITSIFLFSIVQSCYSRCDEKTYEGKWQSMTLSWGHTAQVPYGYIFKETTDSTITDSIPGIRMVVQYNNINVIASRNNWLFSSAYASQPCDDIYVHLHEPLRLVVHTLREYSNTYPANSDITSLFTELGYDSTGYWGNFKPIRQYSDSGYNIYHYGEYDLERELFLTDTTTTIDSILEFKVTVFFSDSTSVSAKTKPVRRHR